MDVALPPRSEHLTFDPTGSPPRVKPELVVRAPDEARVCIELEADVSLRPRFFHTPNDSPGDVPRVGAGGVLWPPSGRRR